MYIFTNLLALRGCIKREKWENNEVNIQHNHVCWVSDNKSLSTDHNIHI